MTPSTPGSNAATAARSATQATPVAPGALELYVYYRVHVDDAAQALAVAQACQRQMCATLPGLVARLLRRPEWTDAHQTWMETYRFDPAGHGHPDRGVEAALQREIETLAAPLNRFIRGPRHVETFVPCV